jgi:hypothetical protein
MTDEELIKQLREVTGGKLFFTNTPNHLRLTAADHLEQLQAKLKASEEIGRAFEEDAGQLRAKLAKAVAYIEHSAKSLAVAFGPDADWRKVSPYAAQIITEIKGET